MRRLVPAALAALAIGCGSPAAPDAALPLSATTYSLTAGATFNLCRDVTLPQVVRYIAVWVRLSLDGATWIGRPLTAESGAFELRLDRGSGPEGFGAVPLRGTFTGYLQDVGVAPFEPPSGIRLEAADAGTTIVINGSAAKTGSTSSGTFASPLTFRNATRSMTCPAESLSWALIRNAPPN